MPRQSVEQHHRSSWMLVLSWIRYWIVVSSVLAHDLIDNDEMCVSSVLSWKCIRVFLIQI